MIDEVTAGAKVKLREKISDSVPVGSIATVGLSTQNCTKII